MKKVSRVEELEEKILNGNLSQKELEEVYSEILKEEQKFDAKQENLDQQLDELDQKIEKSEKRGKFFSRLIDYAMVFSVLVGFGLIFYSLVSQVDTWFIGLCFILPAGFYFYSQKKEKQRTERIKKFSYQNGMEFLNDEYIDLDYSSEDSKKLELFNKGNYGGSFSNVLKTTRDNADLFIFDYQYTQGTGDSKSHYEQTVCLFRKAERNLPEFTLKPERFYHKIGSVFGYQDVDFSSDSGFSKKYLLRGKDENAIRMIFGPEKLHYFKMNSGLSVESGITDLIVYKHNKRVKVKNLSNFIQTATEINNMFN